MLDRRWLVATTSLTALTFVPSLAIAADLTVPVRPAVAVDLPAVSTVNGKIGAFGGTFDDHGGFGIIGSLDIPLAHRWGLQIDGLAGSGDGGGFYGIGGHLFWRDPSAGLFGVYGSYLAWDASHTFPASYPAGGVFDVFGAEVGKVGLEGESYLGGVTLSAMLGYQYGSRSGLTGRVNAAFYATDEFRLDLGAHYLQGLGLVGTVGAEWHITNTPASLFASGGLGPNSHNYAMGGVRFAFGAPTKSLIRRDREDDPAVTLPEDLFTITGHAYCPPGTIDRGSFCDGNV